MTNELLEAAAQLELCAKSNPDAPYLQSVLRKVSKLLQKDRPGWLELIPSRDTSGNVVAKNVLIKCVNTPDDHVTLSLQVGKLAIHSFGVTLLDEERARLLQQAVEAYNRGRFTAFVETL
jgi:hypothetical protein